MQATQQKGTNLVVHRTWRRKGARHCGSGQRSASSAPSATCTAAWPATHALHQKWLHSAGRTHCAPATSSRHTPHVHTPCAQRFPLNSSVCAGHGRSSSIMKQGAAQGAACSSCLALWRSGKDDDRARDSDKVCRIQEVQDLLPLKAHLTRQLYKHPHMLHAPPAKAGILARRCTLAASAAHPPRLSACAASPMPFSLLA